MYKFILLVYLLIFLCAKRYWPVNVLYDVIAWIWYEGWEIFPHLKDWNARFLEYVLRYFDKYYMVA